MKKLLVLAGLLACTTKLLAAQFTLFDQNGAAHIFVDENEAAYVKTAVADLKSDTAKVGNIELADTKNAAEPALFVGSLTNPKFKKLAEKLGINAKEIEGGFERFAFAHVGKNSFAIVGSDPRGTMFGIYEFTEKFLGVDPMYFFTNVEPKKRKSVVLSDAEFVSNTPTVKYRGWFVNDEDLLTEFYDGGKKRFIDYLFYNKTIDAKLFEKIAEAAVRAKFNMMIPSSFINIQNPPERELVDICSRRGLYVSMHHVEPLGVSAHTFFHLQKTRDAKKTAFSYFSARAEMVAAWREYAEIWANVPDVIWQIGLRGVGDRPMWMADSSIPKDDAARGKIISEAIAEEVKIIREFDKRKNPPITMTLWNEGSFLYSNGFLKIPDGVIIVFSDNCPGWKMQSDFESGPRPAENKFGIYYHQQLWSCGPHLAQGVPPAQTRKVLARAIEKNSAEYVVLNVSNVREFSLGIAASAKMLFNFDATPQDGGLGDFLSERFGNDAPEMKRLYELYFSSFVLNPSRKVPAWLDGTAQKGIIQNFTLIKNAAKSKKSFDKFVERVKSDTGKVKNRDPETERIWRQFLSDMHFEKGTFPERLAHIKKQSENFENAVSEIEKSLDAMQKPSRQFLHTNLLSHALIMRACSDIYMHSTSAVIALSERNFAAAQSELDKALEAFAHFDRAKEINTDGEWKNWYRGELKMNFDNLLKLAKSARESAEKIKNSDF